MIFLISIEYTNFIILPSEKPTVEILKVSVRVLVNLYFGCGYGAYNLSSLVGWVLEKRGMTVG